MPLPSDLEREFYHRWPHFCADGWRHVMPLLKRPSERRRRRQRRQRRQRRHQDHSHRCHAIVMVVVVVDVSSPLFPPYREMAESAAARFPLVWFFSSSSSPHRLTPPYLHWLYGVIASKSFHFEILLVGSSLRLRTATALSLSS